MITLKQRRSENGFTLVEVLVALIIVGVSLPALMLSIATQVNHLTYAEQKLLAQWVASNEMAKLNVQHRQSGVVSRGKKSGTELMAGQKWPWSQSSEQERSLEGRGIHTVSIDVFTEDGENPLVTQQGSFYDAVLIQPNLAALRQKQTDAQAEGE